jgi:hypothetical protein
VDRLLQVLLHFLNKYEGTSENTIETVSSSVNYYVYTWQIEVSRIETKEKRTISVQSNYTIGSVRRLIARYFQIPTKEIIMK